MCGIAGILDPAGVAAEDVHRMATALAHRGPDDATLHVDGPIGLGFRRLSIIDPAGGRQPIENEDGSLRVILNGEIYNYRELRTGLERSGHRFRTKSDTEVLVHLYEERGDDLVRELRGMFAFALWDGRVRRLLLARDHLGQKPLYWARAGARLYFASEIKAILAVAPRFRDIDPQALDEYLTLRIIADPRSMFAGVRKLPPAHRLIAERDAVRIGRYWELRFEPKHPGSEVDALAELEHEVRHAVRAHLVSDVPVGAFLSGGVDSGLVASIMRAEHGASFRTFSVGVPYRSFDEAPVARRVARGLGTEHVEDTIDGNIITELPRVIHHLDEPSDPLSVCMYHLARMTARHVKVALGGDGGDELFGGYDRYYGTRYVRYYAALPAPVRRGVLRRALDHMPDGTWYKSLGHKLRWIHELAETRGGRRYARSLGYFYFTPRYREALYTDAFRAAVRDFDAEAAIIAWHDAGHTREALDRMLLADSMVRLPNHSVMILDRMCMAHGLEARSPFLDHRLAEFAARLPARLKIRGRRRRYLQMRLAARHLPAEVLGRPKQGFSSALPYLLQRQFRALFGHYLSDARLVQAGLLREPAIGALLDAHLRGVADHGNRLWLLLNAELWYRVHIEARQPEELVHEIGDIVDRHGAAEAPPVAVA
ncbi:MAG TPA: asparagine synthase (glutamine-hydrolyzing) [Longimicrobiales bacterium]